MNSYFKKPTEKLITYKSGGAQTQLDLTMLRVRRGVKAIDCYAVPGEACLTQHRPVCTRLFVERYKITPKRPHRRVQWWKLKNEALRDKYEERVRLSMTGNHGQWKHLENSAIEASVEVCGVTSGKRGRERETWWWSEAVQAVISEKKKAFKVWQRTLTNDDRDIYRMRRREAERASTKSHEKSKGARSLGSGCRDIEAVW